MALAILVQVTLTPRSFQIKVVVAIMCQSMTFDSYSSILDVGRKDLKLGKNTLNV